MLRKRENKRWSTGGLPVGSPGEFADENEAADIDNVPTRKVSALSEAGGPLRSHNSLPTNHRAVAETKTQLNLKQLQGEEPPLSPRTLAATPGDELASTQIVKKALNLLSLDEDGRPSPRNSTAPLFRFDSGSFLDKGFGAFNNVSKMVEGFAVTLDTVIVQAFEDWGTPKASGSRNHLQEEGYPEEHSSRKVPRQAAKQRGEDWQDFEAPVLDDDEHIEAEMEKSRTTKLPASSKSGKGGSDQWRKRAQILHRELQKVRTQQQEFQRLKDEYMRLKGQLHQCSPVKPKASSSSKDDEAEQPELTGLFPGLDDPAVSDPMAAQQIREQMQNLLEEKAKLSQENDRLLRENTGLQELLDFTMMGQADMVGDDELFADYNDYLPSSAPKTPTKDHEEEEEVQAAEV